jgi:hypothetical protein
MRAVLFAGLMILVGCAQQPLATPAGPGGAQAADGRPPNRSGYRLVKRDDGYVYCRTDMVTASHIQSTVVCLTPGQLAQQDLINQQELGGPTRPLNPPHGNSPR